MARPVLSDVTSSYASVAAINANSALIEQGFIDALSRNDLTNNFMQVPLDMNSNQILNLGEPLSNNSAATKKYVDDLAFTLSGVDVGLFVTDAELAAAVDVLRAGGITYTPTYATLTDYPGTLFFGQIFYTGARTTSGDGGQGHWYFRTDRPFTPDAGTVINRTAGGQFVRLRNETHFDVSWWGAYAGNTAAANVTAFKALETIIAAIRPKSILLVCSGGTGQYVDLEFAIGQTFFNFLNHDRVDIDTQGKTWRTDQVYAPATTASGIVFNQIKELNVKGRFEQSQWTYGSHGGNIGTNWLLIYGTCHKSNLDIYMSGGNMGVAFIRNTVDAREVRTSGVHSIRMYTYGVYYPLSCQMNGDGIDADMWTEQAGRSFIGYGMDDLRLKVTSRDPYSQDLLISTVGSALWNGTGANCGKWDIEYWRRPDTGTVSPTANGIGDVIMRFWGDTDVQTMDWVKLKIFNEAGKTLPFVWIAQTDAGSDDTSLTAYHIGKLEIDMYVPNAPAGEIVDLFKDSKWSSISIKEADINIVVEGNAGATVNFGWYPFSTIREHIIAPVVNYTGTINTSYTTRVPQYFMGAVTQGHVGGNFGQFWASDGGNNFVGTINDNTNFTLGVAPAGSIDTAKSLNVDYATGTWKVGTNPVVVQNINQTGFRLTDGVTTPSTVSGAAIIFVDSADGDLKVKFGDGTVKLIVADT